MTIQSEMKLNRQRISVTVAVLTQLMNLLRTALDQLVQLPLLLAESLQLRMIVFIQLSAPVHKHSKRPGSTAKQATLKISNLH